VRVSARGKVTREAAQVPRARNNIMPVTKIVRKLSYHPWVIKAVRGLGLRGFARKVYHCVVASPDGLLRIERGGVAASFVTRKPEHLRAVEAGSLEASLESLARFLVPGDALYDIGSHVGVYSVLLAKIVGKGGTVVAFEPHRETYEQLLGNVKLNGLQNIRAYRVALGERPGEARLYIGEVVANFSLLPGAIVGYQATGTACEPVQVVRGDDFAEAEGLPLPRAVKIDVEGSEFSVLQGLRRTLGDPKCEVVCCEVHPKFLPTDVKPADIIRLLASLGYARIDCEPSDAPSYHVVAYKGVAPPAVSA
jgi:FkbM family methyltransferase